MKTLSFSVEQDGFYGIYYPCSAQSSVSLIAMMGDSCDDFLARHCVKWLHGFGCNVLAMSPAAKDYSHHNLPLERFGAAIAWLQRHGTEKIGIMGMSTTGMAALLAAAYYPALTLTIALTPSDFVMEGFYQEKGIERPGDHESTVSWQGKPLPYLPFAYRHPEYWQKLREEARRGRNRIASREMFDRSEALHPMTEAERIPVERIQGTLLCIGAEDDCLWDTCKYLRRIQAVREKAGMGVQTHCLTFEHGTHFVLPESLLHTILPVGSGALVKVMFQAARDYPKECLETRKEIDRQFRAILQDWGRA